MDTSFAPPQPSAGLLWNDVVSEVSSHSSTTLFPPFCAIPQDPTAYYAQPSAWSVSAIKRCIDFVCAAVALVVFFPLLLLAAVLVRYKSPGPVIFRQRRVGRDGELFTVFKFRTMTIAAQQDGPSLTKRGDPRITPFGGFLRKYKLDELPQFVNVLRGEMSLVGPRPKLPHLEVMHMPFRPGLTGAATLAFRCEEEMLQDIPDDELEAYYCRMIKPLKAKIDWDYMREATLMSDFSLLYETVFCCVSSRANSWVDDFSKSA
jgi:lipopolysaccharide/colanic/teichoic acid biosynthesis glycosyltransferase